MPELRGGVCAKMNKADLKLDWCSHAAAKWAVEHWHYSKTMPAGKRVSIGVWESGRFVGCVIFGTGACPQIACPFGIDRLEAAELVRVALRKHETPVSRIVSVALRMVKMQSPGLRIIVSYADPNAGHVGGIYQAGNWYYVGTGGAPWRANGVHNRVFGTVKAKARARFGPNVIFTLEPPKHKYVYPLDSAMRAQIEPLRKPYPKRAGSIASDATANQAGKGGATPTSALLIEPTSP